MSYVWEEAMDMSDEEIEEVYRLDLERRAEVSTRETAKPGLTSSVLKAAGFWALFMAVVYEFCIKVGQ